MNTIPNDSLQIQTTLDAIQRECKQATVPLLRVVEEGVKAVHQFHFDIGGLQNYEAVDIRKSAEHQAAFQRLAAVRGPVVYVFEICPQAIQAPYWRLQKPMRASEQCQPSAQHRRHLTSALRGKSKERPMGTGYPAPWLFKNSRHPRATALPLDAGTSIRIEVNGFRVRG